MSHARRATRRFRTGALLLGLPLLLLLSGPRKCAPGVPYRLAPGSSLVEGCIDGPCLCPVASAELQGDFRLVELPTFAPGPTRQFGLQDVNFRAGSEEHARKLRGEGLYQNDPLNERHRILLQLRIDGGPVQTFDSGLVEGGQGFPKIAISARIQGGGACFDVILNLRAAPLGLPGVKCQDNSGCAASDYCEKPLGQCFEAGVCQPRGDACPLVYDPVCGCDGATYGNACEAGLAGVSVQAEGPCLPSQ